MNIASLARRGIAALAAGTVLGFGSVATASPVTLVPTGFANGSEQFNVSVPTALGTAPLPTGAFVGTIDDSPAPPPPKPLVFFCFELTQTFSFGTSYTYDDSVQTGGIYTTLSELFTEGFATALDSTQNSAAFQLAIWEILEEPAGTQKSLSPGADQGTFYVTNDHGNTATVTAANALIAGLPPIGLYEIHLLSNDTNQNFIYGTPIPPLQQVPEPAPLLLFAAALAAMLFGLRSASRRRS